MKVINDKVVLSLFVLSIILIFIYNIILLDQHFKSINIDIVETFPVVNGKVLVNNKEIETQAFKRLVNITVEQATSSASVQNKVETIIGGKIDDITLGEENFNEIEKIEYKEVNHFQNDWTRDMIYNIYKHNKYLIHRMIKIYDRKWADPNFRQKVERFVDENE